MNKKPKYDKEFLWFVTVVPLAYDKFYLGFRPEEGLGPYLSVQWCTESGFDIEKGLISIKCESEHEAFWICYQKSIEYITAHGIQNVRSDVFPEAELCPSVLSHINGLINHKIISNYSELTCNRCLRIGHSGELCYTETNMRGQLIDKSSESSSPNSSN